MFSGSIRPDRNCPPRLSAGVRRVLQYVEQKWPGVERVMPHPANSQRSRRPAMLPVASDRTLGATKMAAPKANMMPKNLAQKISSVK